MPAPLPPHASMHALTGGQSSSTCIYLTYRLKLLTHCIGDGVLVGNNRARCCRRGYKRWYRGDSAPSSFLQHLNKVSSTHVQSCQALITPSLILLQELVIHYHVVYSLLSIPADRLTPSQCSWEATAIPTVCKAQPQFVKLQPILGVATRATGERFHVWRRCLFQCLQPIWRQRI